MVPEHGYNLPPGVTSGMLPGNTSADERWERALEAASDEVADICTQRAEECDHALITLGNSEVIVGCYLGIVKVTDAFSERPMFRRDRTNDASQCPYVIQRAEEISDEMREGIWGR